MTGNSAAGRLDRLRAVRNLLALAQKAHASGTRSELDACLRSARTSAGSNGAAHAVVGDFHLHIEDYPGALAAYDQALTLAPGDARFLFNRAAIRRFLGDLAGAERDYDAAIAAAPHDAEAYLNRSDLRRQTPDRNHVAELSQLLEKPALAWLDEVRLRYAIAKEYEDLGRYADAWVDLSRAASLRRRHMQYDIENDLKTVDWIKSAHRAAPGAADLAEPGGPLFIVGLPRTGSTLLERMIGGHSAVRSVGESTAFVEAMMQVLRGQMGGQAGGRRELIEQSAAMDFHALKVGYLERLQRRVPPGARSLDKMPLNYLYCGLIRRALPEARIIHMRRHPMAVCYAMYKTLFNQAYPFSYDLEELGRYFLGYRRLMDHWERVNGGQMLDVSYERLVSNPEREARRVLEFCGLSWEPGCLEFEHRPGASTTASASQVRQPLYHSSVNLWRQYAHGLRPLADCLRAGGMAAEELL